MGKLLPTGYSVATLGEENILEICWLHKILNVLNVIKFYT